MTYEGFKYIQLKQNSQQKCEHLLMLELLVTYLNLLRMRNGERKGNQNHQSYYIFTHVNFTIKGENFKLHRHTSGYVLILKQKKHLLQVVG